MVFILNLIDDDNSGLEIDVNETRGDAKSVETRERSEANETAPKFSKISKKSFVWWC